MSYCRWSNSDWYIFWLAKGPLEHKHQEELCIWHCSVQEDGVKKTQFTYPEVKKMLKIEDYSEIACTEITEVEVLVTSMKTWIKEVDCAWKRE